MSSNNSVCAICGDRLTPENRSKSQIGLCKVCAGEAEDNEPAIDDFK